MKHIYYLFTSLLLLTVAFTSCNKSNNDEPIPEVNYTVTFDADGGTPAPPTQTVKEGGKASAPATNPSKTGYTFLFWHLSGATTAYDFATPLTSNISLKAQWETVLEYWNITWELSGGEWPSTSDNHVTQVLKGATLAEPVAPTKEGSSFEGWYAEASLANKLSFPVAVTADKELYAKWVAIDPSSRGEGLYLVNSTRPINLSSTAGDDLLKRAFNYINNQAASAPREYILILENDIVMTPSGPNSGTLGVDLNKSGAMLTIIGKGGVRSITGADKHYMIGVADGMLIIDEQITLKGKCGGLFVFAGNMTDAQATAIMRAGSSIQVRGYSSAVTLGGKSDFIMEGGTISGNVSPSFLSGGGVGIQSEFGTFTMKDGVITDNYADNGGGVHVKGTFVMEGGWIGGNQSIGSGTVYGVTISSSGQGYGGGVNINGGKVILKGGTIYGGNSTITPNKAPQRNGDALYQWSGSSEFGDGTKIIYGSSGAYNQTLVGRN